MTVATIPFNLDAEIAVLSAVLTDAAALDAVRDDLAPSDFYADANRCVYEAILDLNRRGQAIDLMAVADHLRVTGRLERVGGSPYLGSMLYAPAVARIEIPIEIVRRLSVQRQLRALGQTISAESSQPIDDIARHVTRYEARIERLATLAREKGDTGGAVLIPLEAVAPRSVQWLWLGRIPLGKITILDGDPDRAKSILTLDISARVSRGAPMPDGSAGLVEPRGVVLLSAEDDLEDTIRPRLDAAKADPTRIRALKAIRAEDGQRLPTLLDVRAIASAVADVNAALVVVDPLMAFLGGADSHRDQDVRTVLARLADLAARLGVAVFVVRHLNKSSGGRALYRGGGSIGIIGAARSGLLAADDPSDDTGQRRILAVTKHNLCSSPPALVYRVEVTDGCPHVLWEGVSTHTADTLVAATPSPEERSALDEAKDWLRTELAEGPMPARQVLNRAHAVGISEMTLRRAALALSIRRGKRGRPGEDGGWVWSLPGAAP